MVFSVRKGVRFDASKDIPPLSGKVVLITGGNTGLGKQSVIEFAKHNPAELWLTARDLARAQKVVQDVQKEVPGSNMHILELDLASLDSVENACRNFLSSTRRLDILILNAGLGGSPPSITQDGYEVFFGINHLGHALFTNLLIPLLLSTIVQQQHDVKQNGDVKCKTKASDVRVVVLTSAMMSCVPEGGIQFETLKTPQIDIGTSFTHYGQSKLANTLFARRLAKEYPLLTVAAVHPGLVKTGIGDKTAQHNILARLFLPVAKFFMVTVEEGVKNQLWAATSENVVSGEYYTPIGVPGKTSKFAVDDVLAEKLWEWTAMELQTRLHGRVI